MTWHTRRMCVFDLETTGKNPEEARIVTACVGHVGGGLDTDVRQWVVNPGVEIPQEATDVHGITTEYAQTFGDDPVRAVAEIATALREAWSIGCPVVAFNGVYDFTVLDREVRRHGLGDGFPVTGPVVDPFVIDRHLDPYRKGKRTLTSMCEHYGVQLDGAHDATADAVAAARVAWKLATTRMEVSRLTLEELHEAQAKWHRARQESYAAYLRKRNEDASGVCTAWPLRPFRALAEVAG